MRYFPTAEDMKSWSKASWASRLVSASPWARARAKACQFGRFRNAGFSFLRNCSSASRLTAPWAIGSWKIGLQSKAKVRGSATGWPLADSTVSATSMA